MEDFEKAIKLNNLYRQLGIETEFDQPLEELIKGGEGSRGGRVIGHTKSGKPVYADAHAGQYNNFNEDDHKDAAALHERIMKRATAIGSLTLREHHKHKMHSHKRACGAMVELAIDSELEKAASGTYKNNAENRKHGRVGERYGNMVNGGSTQDLEAGEKIDKTQVKKWVNTRFIQAGKWPDDFEVGISSDGKLVGIKEKSTGAFKIFHYGSSEVDRVEKWLKEEKKGDFTIRKSIETILKAFETGLLSKDVFEKGKRGQIGETRTWNGVQMKKVSNTGNSGKDWQPIKQGEQKQGAAQPGAGAQPKLTEEDLKLHAQQSSEQALANAIKSSPDPVVRRVAQAEIHRRKTEEAPEDGKGVFPSREFMSGAGQKAGGNPDDLSNWQTPDPKEFAATPKKYKDAFKEALKDIKVNPDYHKNKNIKKSIQGIRYF